MEKISIIVPFYNVEGCIKHCIESVASQTYGNLEVLWIDDCGKDSSRSILENFIDNYKGPIDFRIITQEHNQGQSAARNRGILESTGSFIFFLDSDDYISKDCIATLYNEIEKDNTVQMVIGNYKIEGPLYLVPFCMQQRVHNSEEIIREQLSFGIYTMPWNKLVKRDFLLRNHLLFEPGIIHEDNLWSYCSAFCLDKIAVVLKPTYYYVIRQGSTERSHSRKWHQEQLFEVFKCLVHFIFESDAPDKKDVKHMANVFRFLQNSIVPFIMEPLIEGNKTLSQARYREIRSLPYWTQEEVKQLKNIKWKEKRKFSHFNLPVEKGFRQFIRRNRKYQIPNEINTMKISVITVNYNNLEGLKRTLPSILCQTYTGYELIVVDGGSTDGSKEYIQAQERIDQWLSEPDEGVYNAMNKAVRMAHGEYCIFMNSGDTFFSATVLETVIGKLRGDDFYTGCSTFVEKQNTYTCFPPQKMNIDFLLVNSLNHQATFNKTALLRDNPFNEKYRITADWGLFTRKWIKGECTYTCLPNDMIAIYYMDGMSSMNKEGAMMERMLQLEELVNEIGNEFQKTKIKKTIDWYRNIFGSVEALTNADDGSEGRTLRHRRKLLRKINDAMNMPPLQRDMKIARNAIKMFFKDLF